MSAGSLNDAIFKIIGCDYITIARFTMMENAANTITSLASNNMTEWGVALLRSSTTDGAQYNRIIDNNISLDKTYPNSFGVYSNVRHSATVVGTTVDITNGTTAPNHGNKVYKNRISNVNMGIAFIGSNTDARMDNYNDIGGYASVSGNSVINWGGTSLVTATFAGNMSNQYYGIFSRCQKQDNVSWNTITGSTTMSGLVAAPVRGIQKSTTTGTVTGSFSSTIDHNTINITDNLPNGSSSMSRLDGIYCSDKLSYASLYIRNNIINGLAVTGTNSNRQIRGINNVASAGAVYINNNIIKGCTSTATAIGGWFIGIDQTGSVSSSLEINDNFIGESTSTTPAITYSATANGSTVVRGISNVQSLNPVGTAVVSISNNSLYGFVQTNGASNNHAYIYCDHTTTIDSDIHIDGNNFINLDAHITGDVFFISTPGVMAADAGAQLSVSNNNIEGAFSKSLPGGDVYVYYANGTSSTGNRMKEDGNNFSNITLTGSTLMHGWHNNEGGAAAGPQKSITNNVFENWTCGTSGAGTTNVIYCNWASGNSEISGNRITEIAAPGDVNGILSESATATMLKLNGGNISGLSTSGINSNITGTNFTALSANTFVQNMYFSAIQNMSGTVKGFNIPATPNTNIHFNYNTVYVNVTSGNSAALYVTSSSNPMSGKASIRNNILVNISTGSGRAVAIWRTSPDFSNLESMSDNNVLYVTPGTNHFVFYNVYSSCTTLAAYIAVLPTLYVNTERHSLQQFPIFRSSTDHRLSLSPGTNCRILNGGNNEGIYLDHDEDLLYFPVPPDPNDPRMVVFPYVTDIGADQVTQTNTWTGKAGTSSWNDPHNWSLGTMPDVEIVPNDISMNVYIPNVTPTYFQPLVEDEWQIFDLLFEPTSVLPLLDNNNGLLKIAGQINGNDGSFNNHDVSSPQFVTGSVELNGVCDIQSIRGAVFVNGDVSDFTVSDLADDVVISPFGGSLRIHGELGFGAAGAHLVTGNNVTLVSTALRTANVGQMTNLNFISGDVTVERYINTGVTPANFPYPAQHAKAWQLLSTPTGANSSSQSVKNSWMEGGNNSIIGYGTQIPDPSGPANGFDPSSPAMLSIKTFVPSTSTYNGIANTATPLYNRTGYFLFVRGDRTVSSISSDPTPTTLRSKGILFQPYPGFTPPSVTVPASRFASVGNPYASAIDLGFMNTHGNFTGIKNTITVWDPTLGGAYGVGGYQYIDRTTFKPTPGGTALYNASLSYPEIQSGQAFFVESSSTTSTGPSGLVAFTEGIKSSNQRLVTRLADVTDRKYFNASLYLDSSILDGNSTSFDAGYSDSIDANDAGKLFNFSENFMLYRTDNFLAIEGRNLIDATDTIFYTFNNMLAKKYQLGFAPINMNEGGLNAILVDNYLDSVIPLSLEDSTFVNFTINDDSLSYFNRYYVVFNRVAEFTRSNTIPAVENSRMADDGILIFPNPVENKVINIRLGNKPADNYKVLLINKTGQVVYTGSINNHGVSIGSSIKLNKSINAGSYDLKLIPSKGNQIVQQIIVR